MFPLELIKICVVNSPSAFFSFLLHKYLRVMSVESSHHQMGLLKIEPDYLFYISEAEA